MEEFSKRIVSFIVCLFIVLCNIGDSIKTAAGNFYQKLFENELRGASSSVSEQLTDDKADESNISSGITAAAPQTPMPVKLADYPEVNPYSTIGYNSLNEAEQKAYREIVSHLKNRDEEFTVDRLSYDSVDKIEDAISVDHPELFYFIFLNSNSYLEDTTKIEPYYSSVASSYKFDDYRKTIETEVEKIVKSVPENADDYEKVKYIFEYIADTTTYDIDSPDNQNVYSVFANHVTVCAGYSRAVQMLLNRLGIECTYVRGWLDDVRHAWNIVKLHGEYYYIDVTNADQENELDIYYEFFNFNEDYLKRAGYTVDRKNIDIPQANGVRDSYFMHEGRYFTEYTVYDIAGMAAKAAAEGGRNFVWFKFASKKAYDNAIQDLIYEYNLDIIFYGCCDINANINYDDCDLYGFDEDYMMVIRF